MTYWCFEEDPTLRIKSFIERSDDEITPVFELKVECEFFSSQRKKYMCNESYYGAVLLLWTKSGLSVGLPGIRYGQCFVELGAAWWTVVRLFFYRWHIIKEEMIVLLEPKNIISSTNVFHWKLVRSHLVKKTVWDASYLFLWCLQLLVTSLPLFLPSWI